MERPRVKIGCEGCHTEPATAEDSLMPTKNANCTQIRIGTGRLQCCPMQGALQRTKGAAGRAGLGSHIWRRREG